MGKLNSTFQNNPQTKGEWEGKLENILNWIKMQTQHKKICGVQLRQCLKGCLQSSMLVGGKKKGFESIFYALTLRN